MRSVLAGVGAALPERIVTNAELEAELGGRPGWVQDLLGIVERRAAAPGELGYHLGTRAALAALADAGVAPAGVELLVYHTNFPDYSLPGGGVLVQRELGLRPGIPVFDLRAQCAGFLYAWLAADVYLATGAVRCALVVCGERLFSNCIIYPPVAPIFGDAGAAAVLLATPDDRGLLDVRAYTDGAGAEFGLVSSDHYDFLDPARRIPSEMVAAVEDWRRAPLSRPLAQRFDGSVIYKQAVTRMTQATREMLDAHGLQIGDVDWYLFHQANKGIVERVGRLLKLPPERVLTNLGPYGNTSSASIPLLLADARRRGQLRSGQLLLLCAFATGFLWAAALYRV
jgi:3-oxoacyl-[acyl-carrier-protein] synthase-3